MHMLLNQEPAPAIVWQTFKRGVDACVLFNGDQAFEGHISTFRRELGQISTW